jgi:class 3 adenylate cyclase
MPSVRRLTAILAADVAGYSRLMGADEEGTHERLKAHLGELVEPKISQHRGRTVKNTGDGLLAEFVSVVDAVRCAPEPRHRPKPGSGPRCHDAHHRLCRTARPPRTSLPVPHRGNAGWHPCERTRAHLQ